MDVHDVFTAESIEAFRQRKAEADGLGGHLVDQYLQDRADQLRNEPALREWIDALENGDLAAATEAVLWSRLSAQGFIEVPTARTPHSDRGVFLLRIISPKIFDGFRAADGPRADYAFTTIKVCLRRDAIPDKVTVPESWRYPALVDTELFELPAEVSEDTFDDREKIHLIFIAGIEDGQFVSKPVYIGIGTGEAYGTGPRRRTTRGRFRFYRYDVKDNLQVEYIRMTEGRQYEKVDVQSVPRVPPIGDTRADLLLARGSADSNFMSLSDPNVAEWYAVWLKDHQHNRLVFREITLEKVHDDLRTGRPTTPFHPYDVAASLAHAWRVQRWYYVAWQHPSRLTATEVIDLYYDELPAFRRQEYEIYRFKPEIFGLNSDDPEGAGLTVPRVLRSEELHRRLESGKPEAAARVKRWLREGVVKDLYAYGSHPELRLYTAIALWQRLSASGVWDAAVEAVYRGRLFDLDFGVERVCAVPAAGAGER